MIAQRLKPDGSLEGDPLHFSTWSWAGKGKLERVRYEDHNNPPREDGLTNNFGDEFHDGKRRYILTNWDPNNPQQITIVNNGTVKAHIGPQTKRFEVGRDPAVHLLRMLSVPLGADNRWSLSEFVAASPKAEIVAEPSVGNEGLWCIRADHPGIRGGAPNGTYVEIFIDPSVNFAIRKVIEHQVFLNPTEDGDTEKSEYLAVRRVTKFKSFENGVFFPLEAELEFYRNGEDQPVTSVIRVVVEDVVVNQPLSKEALDFQIPANLLVKHFPPVKGWYRTQVWGPGNKPVQEFTTEKEMKAFLTISTNAVAGFSGRGPRSEHDPPPARDSQRGRHRVYRSIYAASSSASIAMIQFRWWC